jgi:deazaflavin-dependent oxidoreductase (nitroreductase family)
MNVKPNSYQKVFHRLLMLKPVSALLAVVLHRADTLLLRLTKGRRTFTRIAGLPIVQLTAKGAKTGQWRTMPLVGVPDGEKFVLIASNFGQKHFPGWYHNLKANPECEVRVNGSSKMYVARESVDDEREHYYQLAVSYYAGYVKYAERASPRTIPVMVLEPINSQG